MRFLVNNCLGNTCVQVGVGSKLEDDVENVHQKKNHAGTTADLDGLSVGVRAI